MYLSAQAPLSLSASAHRPPPPLLQSRPPLPSPSHSTPSSSTSPVAPSLRPNPIPKTTPATTRVSPPSFYISQAALTSASTTSLPLNNNYPDSPSLNRPRSYTSAPLSARLHPPSPRDLPSPEKQHNHVRGLDSTKGLTLELPDNPFTSNSNSLNLLGALQPEIRTPGSPTRSPRSAKTTSSTSRSPSLSPRKRSTTTGSRYSPPPAFGNRISTSSDLPPPTPPLPRSPAARDTAHSDHLAVSSPKPSPRKTNNIINSPAKSPVKTARSHQSPTKSTLLGKGAITAVTSIATTTTTQRQPASTMASDASRRAIRSASGTRPTHSRAFSTDMRQLSSEDVARQREQREQDRDRKAMLNRALQKAHTAVLLDNAYNYEGAIDAYREACNLLHQVLLRSTADEERRKLDQIVSLFRSSTLSK